MHPPRFKHARSLHALAAVAMLASIVLGLSGCDSSGSRPEASFMPSDTITSAVDRDSVLSVLSSMRREAFDSAFAALDQYNVTRYVRTEQLDPTGAATAVRSYVLDYPSSPGRGTIRRSDSVGTFGGGGLFGRVAPDRNPRQRPPDMAAQVLPDQPPYIEPRTREAYRYALRADTLRAGLPVYVLEATARDRGTGREQGVRFVRLLLEQSSHQLIGLTTVRADEVLLFSENSRFNIRLRRAPESSDRSEKTWVPHRTRVRAVVDVPLRAPRQFRTVSAFYNYRR